MATSLLTAPAAVAVKTALLAECFVRQHAQADAARRAMEDAQASANGHAGAMEDKFESFRENCQIQRDLFARQLAEALAGLATLHRIGVDAPAPAVAGLGALIETDRSARFFLAISAGPLTVPAAAPAADAPWMVVSTASPIGQALVGRRVGERFTFRGETHCVTAVW